MLTQEQLADRRNGIYGSEAAAILCAYPENAVWAEEETPYNLWQKKLGLIPPKDLSDDHRVQAGHYFEPGILNRFEKVKGLEVDRASETLVHPGYSWMRGHVDGITYTKDGKRAIVEAKTAGIRQAKYWNKETNTVPDHYLIQVAHYMAVADADMAFIAVCIGGNDFHEFEIQRNEKLESILIEKETRFWNENVLKQIPPEFETVDDIRAYYPKSVDKFMIASGELLDKFNHMRNLDMQSSDIEKRVKELKKEICHFMGDADTLMDGHGNILATWKTSKAAERINYEKFKKDYPQAYQDCMYLAEPGRPFLIKKEK